MNIELKKVLITKSEFIEMIGIGRTTFWKLQKKQDFPQPINFYESCQRYDKQEALTWIEQQKANRRANV